MLFRDFELENLQQGESIFPIFHFIARDRCYALQQSFKILGIFCHCHITIDGCSWGLKCRGRCRWDLLSKDHSAITLSAQSFLQQKRSLCEGITMNDEEQTSNFEIPYGQAFRNPKYKKAYHRQISSHFYQTSFQCFQNRWWKKYKGIGCCHSHRSDKKSFFSDVV